MPRDPRTTEQINLDLGYSGLDPRWNAASFNPRDYSRRAFTAGRVKSITLYQGRSDITIGLRADGDLGFDPQSADFEGMRPFGDNVFVSCGYK